ncbi:ras-related protein Rab-36-like isoform X1 [Leptotrombidium deliense]|uniref:Ras-related protein Rab-36-like isoform X1 n=1 Tax=Leptotrombidium deliense TaxID=299467 RepID=A0A443SGI9_9ACAR|nr:ras-related protein Rab-36-like isoform X1 [Leptotrombidium deliense]
MVGRIGSKKDTLLPSVHDFVESEGIKVAKQLGAEYLSVSAQTGENVELLFTRIAVLTFQEMVWREIEAIDSEKNCTADNGNGNVVLHYSNSFVKQKKRKSSKTNCFSIKRFFK